MSKSKPTKKAAAKKAAPRDKTAHRTRVRVPANASAAQLVESVEAVIHGMDAKAPTAYNERGAGQSFIPYRFDLIDGPAQFQMAQVLHQGAEKYGANNWRGIDIEDHLNHLVAHAYAWLAGDHSDAHLSHIMCRAMFAQAVQLQCGPVDVKRSGLTR